MSVSVCMCSIQADCYPSFGLVSLASCVREGESWGLVPPTAKNTPRLHTLQGCILQGGEALIVLCLLWVIFYFKEWVQQIES